MGSLAAGPERLQCWDAASLSPSCIAQAKRLRAEGFVTRNTFIDVDTPTSCLDTSEFFTACGASSPACRRGRSAPPPSLRAPDDEDNDEKEASVRVSLASVGTCSGGVSSGSDGECSSDQSDSDARARAAPCRSEVGVGHTPPTQLPLAVLTTTNGIWLLPALLERECGFLRLQGHSFQVEACPKARRKGTTAVLRVWVRGLPLAKRAKWLLPLRRSVARLLQKEGVAAVLEGGELYVIIQDGENGRTLRVRIDLHGCRRSDEFV